MCANFWDRWWMVFDIPPHNNLEDPFYFIKKLYAKFMLGLKVNYWSMKPNMGVGGGAPQHRPSSQRKKAGTFIPLLMSPPLLECNIVISLERLALRLLEPSID